MSGFVELTHYKTDEPVYVRADLVATVTGLPPREAGLTSRVGPLEELPARTIVVLTLPGDKWDGTTRPANVVCLETPSEVMDRVRAAIS